MTDAVQLSGTKDHHKILASTLCMPLEAYLKSAFYKGIVWISGTVHFFKLDCH